MNQGTRTTRALTPLIQTGPFIMRYRRSANDRLLALIEAGKDKLAGAWANKRVRRSAIALLALAIVGGSVGAYFALRDRATPDYLADDLDDVLDYTLLSGDFNKLPLDQRMKLMKDMIARLKGMGSGDSAMMAAFAAGLSGKAMEQARENMEILAVDLWDDFAVKYRDVPKDDRESYLDASFLEFSRLMEDVSGFSDKRSEADRLADTKKQARRDMQRGPAPGAMQPDRANGLMKIVQDRGQKVSSPEQRGRMGKFTRDMARNLRGQDIDSGQTKDAPPATDPGK